MSLLFPSLTYDLLYHHPCQDIPLLLCIFVTILSIGMYHIVSWNTEYSPVVVVFPTIFCGPSSEWYSVDTDRSQIEL